MRHRDSVYPPRLRPRRGAGAAAVSGPLKKKASQESLDSLFLTVKMFHLGFAGKITGVSEPSASFFLSFYHAPQGLNDFHIAT